MNFTWTIWLALFGLIFGHGLPGAVVGGITGFIIDSLRQGQRRRATPQAGGYISPLFALLGAVSKSDGRVSEAEIAVAERLMASYDHGLWLVDLAPLGDPRLVPSAVATVLGLEIRAEDPLPGLVASLRDKRMLLLLDNCEHVIGAVASLAAAVLSATPDISILATSREPLGVAGEREYRLGPLSSPQP